MESVKKKANLKIAMWSIALMVLLVGNICYDTPVARAETMVYITKTGARYHTHKCGNGTYYTITLSDATARGLTPCEKCYGNNSSYNDDNSNTNNALTDYNGSDSGGSNSNDSKEAVVKPIKINKTSIVLVKGQTSKLKITNATEKITWDSSKKSVASVSSDGKVIAKKKGKTVITATVGNQKKTCKVTVEVPKLSEKSLTMDIGDKYKISLSGCKHSVRWSSSDPNVAKISGGKITAKNPGKTTIVAKVHNRKYKCVVKVNKPKVTKVSLGKTKIQMGYNKCTEISVGITPQKALKYYDISVKSSDESVVDAFVSYDNKSIILETGEKTGFAKVAVSIGKVTAECQVTVIPSVISSFSLDKTEMTLKPDETEELSITVEPDEAMDYYDVVWASSDPSVVAVEPVNSWNKGYGKVSAVGEGEADITVTIGKKKATCHVGVAKLEMR